MFNAAEAFNMDSHREKVQVRDLDVLCQQFSITSCPSAWCDVYSAVHLSMMLAKAVAAQASEVREGRLSGLRGIFDFQVWG